MKTTSTPAARGKFNEVFRLLAVAFRWRRPAAAFSGQALLSAWISKNPHRQIRGVYVQSAVVPCGPCRVCCRQGNVILDTRIDHLSDYNVDEGVDPTGKTVYRLKQHDDGSCGYLDPETHNCTIYEKRPSLCKTFDCRQYAEYTDAQLLRVFMVPRHGFLIRDAAKEAIQRDHLRTT